MATTMKLSRTQSIAFVNPSLHLRMFGLRNPMVAWAIAYGAYPDEDRPPTLRDVGDVASRVLATRMGIALSTRPQDQYEEM